MNRHTHESQKRSHLRAFELLPWYANGTLEAAERRSVEEHLAECDVCREELGRCQTFGAEVRRAEVAAPAPHPKQLERLLEQVEEIEATPRAVTGLANPWRRLSALVAVSPRGVRGLLAAQLAALFVLAAVLAWQARSTPATFHTLSEAPAVAPAATAQLRVVFTPQTREEEMRKLLFEIRGHIVAGPSPLGVYTIEVAAGDGADPVSVVLQHLRSSPAVSFAEPLRRSPSSASRELGDRR